MSLKDDYDVERYAFQKRCAVEVYRCTHRSTGAQRAVKIYDTSTLDARRIAMAKEEGELARSLPRSPQLVHVLDVYSEQGHIAIVMEFFDRGSLFQHLSSRGPVGEAVARDIMRQLLTGLALLHASGVMHRDIKPENIFLRSGEGSMSVAIGDFGFATRRIPHEALVGSPQYSAPELALIGLQQRRDHPATQLPTSARPLYNEKCDVWSAGVVLFVMLSGLLPFDGATPEEVFTAVMRNAVPFAAVPQGRMSPAAASFIRLLLTPNPSKRPSASAALRNAWLTG